MSNTFNIPPGLTTLLEGFVVKCIQESPDDLVEFAADYFTMFKRRKDKNQASKEKKAAEIDKDDLPSCEAPKPTTGRRRRQAVAAEAYDPNAEGDVKTIHYPKSDEQMKRLREAVKNILLFKACEVEQLQEVLKGMFEKRVKPEEMLIKQGDEGDNFYVIDSGDYDVFIDQPDGPPKKVFTYKSSGSFGELALLYNCPRNATIIAKTEGIVWALDQSTFRRIVAGAAMRKRDKYINLLKKVDMLENLKSEELENLADALEQSIFEDGQCIIKEKDEADCMYFIEVGKVRITVSDGKTEKEISILSNGGIFGELALVMKQTRSASVYSKGKCKCARLTVDAFERLLGPCMDIMKRNATHYEAQRKKLGLDK
jgi:cAMP-dependent protein kinase regulator